MDTKALKDKILQLAIQGKLVEQDPNDETALELIKKIEKEKKKLIKEKKINKCKPLPPITKEEIPFELPNGWEWVRLGTLLNVKSSKRIFAKEYQTSGIPFYRSKEIGELSSGQDTTSELYISIERYNKIIEKYGVPQKGDLLLTSVGTIGNTWIVDDRKFYYKDGNITQLEKNDHVNMYYIEYLIKSSYFLNMVNAQVSGTAYNALTITKINNLILLLPPLAEQKRIVEKVDELFALIDKLDSDKEELLDIINKTRNKVLQEAIKGNLVPQDEKDEPASELIKKIEKEKKRLIKEKKSKPLPPIKKEEIPFELPNGWEWVRLGDISIVNMGQSPKGNTVNDKDGIEFHQGKVFFGDKFLNKSDKYTIDPKKIAHKDDVLISVRAPVGTVNITDREICIGRGLCSISSLGNINRDYYYYFISAFKKYLLDKATGTTFLAVTATTINKMPIPLPPLAEQKRIINKIDKLMALCDELEKQLMVKEK